MPRGLPLRIPERAMSPASTRSAALFAWDAVVVAATVFGAGHAALLAVLPAPPVWAVTLDAWITLLFVVDVVLRFRRPVRVDGRPVTEPRIVARRYLRGWFAVDLAAAMPFGLLSFALGGGASEAGRVLALLGLTRALRLARVARLQAEWRGQMVIHPAVYRLAFFAFWAAMLAHWIACGWLALGGHGEAHTAVPRYLAALYWTVTTLTTVGYGDVTPAGSAQVAYAMAVMVLGVGMYGYVIGNVANLLGNADERRAKHLERLERTTLLLRERGVSAQLRRRVREYFEYLWESGRGRDERLLDDLPAGLRVDLSLELHREMLDRVPLFRGADVSFLREVVRHLRSAVFTPGEYICRRGDVGHRMFFLVRGAVEVLGADERTAVATLTDGDFFGEMSLLGGQRRMASVRAVDYCDLETLDRDRFEEVLAQFPAFATEVRRTAAARSGPEDATATPEGGRRDPLNPAAG